jgi:hypothetical protein
MENKLRCQGAECAANEVKEFTFTLKVRVECHHELREAAAERLEGGDEEFAELLGPIEDPSLKDCLMAMVLPRPIPGCTMLSVTID